MLEGSGFLLVTVAGPAVLQRTVVGQQREAAFALWSCFMPAGIAIAMVSAPLFDSGVALWWASAGLSAVVAAAAWRAVPGAGAAAGASASARTVARDMRTTAGARGPLLLAACFALYSLMFFALFSFLPVLIVERMGVTHALARPLSALAAIANIVGNLGAGVLLARGIARGPLVAGANFAMGLCALGIFVAAIGAAPTFVLCLLFSAIGGLIPATLLSSAPLLAPTAALAPMVVGLVMQGSNLGQVIGPIAVGSAVQRHGWEAAAVAVVAAALLAAGTAMGLRGFFGDRPASPRGR